MKKIKDQLADAMSEIRSLREERDSHVEFGALLLLVLFSVIGFFLYNNYDLSQALREKNRQISIIREYDKIESEALLFKQKCLDLKQYAEVSYLNFTRYPVCYVNHVRMDKIEELDKALFHFRLGEAKK